MLFLLQEERDSAVAIGELSVHARLSFRQQTHRSAPLAPAVKSVELPVQAARMSPVKLLTERTGLGTARDMSHCCTVLQEQLRAGRNIRDQSASDGGGSCMGMRQNDVRGTSHHCSVLHGQQAREERKHSQMHSNWPAPGTIRRAFRTMRAKRDGLLVNAVLVRIGNWIKQHLKSHRPCWARARTHPVWPPSATLSTT